MAPVIKYNGRQIMEYKISNYIKLLCINIDHFESQIVDEYNTDNFEEVEQFIYKYQKQKNLKIVIIQMCNMNILTLDNIRRNVHYAVNKKNDLFTVNEFKKRELSFFLCNMLENR